MIKGVIITLLVLMTLMGSVASYYLKLASAVKVKDGLLRTPPFYIGGFLYVVAALINIFLLKYIDFSIMLPLTSITYVWTMLIAWRLLNESITKTKLLGTILIIIGVISLALVP